MRAHVNGIQLVVIIDSKDHIKNELHTYSSQRNHNLVQPIKSLPMR
jgi:hypothetical protein